MIRTLRIAAVLVSVFCVSSVINNAQAQKVNDSLIVSTEWLAKHLDDQSLVLLQVGTPEEYKAAHIPRAQFIHTSDVSTPQGDPLSLQLASVEQLKNTFEKLGVSDNSRIIIYFSKDWVTPTTRIFFTLDYLGLGNRTSILDGGLPAWTVEGRPVTAEVVAPTKGTITPKPNNKLVVDAAWIKDNLQNSDVKIIDARAPQFYTGEQKGRMPRGGRIPGAKSIPFSTLHQGKFVSATTMRERFASADIKASTSVATYCHVGQQATLVYFVARYLGYDARLYDGSFEEWSSKPELPVETDAKP